MTQATTPRPTRGATIAVTSRWSWFALPRGLGRRAAWNRSPAESPSTAHPNATSISYRRKCEFDQKDLEQKGIDAGSEEMIGTFGRREDALRELALEKAKRDLVENNGRDSSGR